MATREKTTIEKRQGRRKQSFDETSRSRDETSRSRDETSRPRDETSRSRDETSRSRDETSRPREKARNKREKASQSREEASQSRDETSRPRDETSQSREEASLSRDETSQSRKETSQSRDETSQSRDENKTFHTLSYEDIDGRETFDPSISPERPYRFLKTDGTIGYINYPLPKPRIYKRNMTEKEQEELSRSIAAINTKRFQRRQPRLSSNISIETIISSSPINCTGITGRQDIAIDDVSSNSSNTHTSTIFPQLPSIVSTPQASLRPPSPIERSDWSQEIETQWNASSYRRAIAHICFAWKSMQRSSLVALESQVMRRCFQRPAALNDKSVLQWFQVMTLVYDMWKHIELSTFYNTSLRSKLYLTMSIGMFEQDTFVNGWATDQGQIVSSLLTNLSSYAHEFGEVRETEWVAERLVTYETSDKSQVITTKMRNNTISHSIISMEESIVCQTPRNDGFCIGVESRRTAQANSIPPIAMPLSVEMRQSKSFTWQDNTYGYSIMSGDEAQPIEWTATISIVWRGQTMLQTDGHMASRQPPRVELSLSTGPISSNASKHLAATMALQTCTAIYVMSSIALMPQDRDTWKWSLYNCE